MAKETYSYGKRDLFIWQKRPIHMAKETYANGKPGPFTLAYLRYSYAQVSVETGDEVTSKRALFPKKRNLLIYWRV